MGSIGLLAGVCGAEVRVLATRAAVVRHSATRATKGTPAASRHFSCQPPRLKRKEPSLPISIPNVDWRRSALKNLDPQLRSTPKRQGVSQQQYEDARPPAWQQKSQQTTQQGLADFAFDEDVDYMDNPFGDGPQETSPYRIGRRVEPNQKNMETLFAPKFQSEDETTYRGWAHDINSPLTEPLPENPDTIHVLGTDPKAMYLAHMVSRLPDSPPVHLILTNRRSTYAWERQGERVQVVRNNHILPSDNVIGEYIGRTRWTGQKRTVDRNRQPKSFYAKQPHITNLIVTLSCFKTIKTLQRIIHRIDHRTTICLVQNGLGVVERLNEMYFPDIAARPTYVLAHMTHDIGYGEDNFTAVELVPGRLVLTPYTALDGWEKHEDADDYKDGEEDGEEEAGSYMEAVDHVENADGYENQRNDSYVGAVDNVENADNADNTKTATDVEHPGNNELVPSHSLQPEYDAGAQSTEEEFREAVEATARFNTMRFVNLLSLTPELGAGSYRNPAFLRYKLVNMIYTAAVEPTATTLDLPMNESLWLNGYARRVVRDLADEMANVVLHLPETRVSKQLTEFVASGSLVRQAMHLSYRQSGGRSVSHGDRHPTLYQDSESYEINKGVYIHTGYCEMARRVAVGMSTDIEYLNGYFVRRGREVGIACPMNEMIIRMLRARQKSSKMRPYQQTYPGTLGFSANIPFEPPSPVQIARAEEGEGNGEQPNPTEPEPHASPAGHFDPPPRYVQYSS